MIFVIYLLVSENKDKTYVGFTDNPERRIDEHLRGKVKTTKRFGKFRWKILEKVNRE